MPEVEINAEFTQTRKILKYRYVISRVELHLSATLIIVLIDEHNQEVHTIIKVIEGKEYDAWGNDDTYLDKIADREVKNLVTMIDLSPELFLE